jgi:hypothetical protein
LLVSNSDSACAPSRASEQASTRALEGRRCAPPGCHSGAVGRKGGGLWGGRGGVRFSLGLRGCIQSSAAWQRVKVTRRVVFAGAALGAAVRSFSGSGGMDSAGSTIAACVPPSACSTRRAAALAAQTCHSRTTNASFGQPCGEQAHSHSAWCPHSQRLTRRAEHPSRLCRCPRVCWRARVRAVCPCPHVLTRHFNRALKRARTHQLRTHAPHIHDDALVHTTAGRDGEHRSAG